MSLLSVPAKKIGGLAVGAALLCSLSLGSFAAAQDGTPMPYTPGTDLGALSGSIESDGSSTVGPITEAVTEEFVKQAGGVEVAVNISGTGGGFKRFCAGETDIQNASRAIKDEEAALCAEAGVEWYEFEVAYDGLAVVVNPAVDFTDCITVEQLNAIWAPDSTVDSWNDVNAEWPDQPIALYGPGTDSGTYDYFTAEINGEEGVSRTDYTPSEDDNVLVQGVAGDESAMAFFGLAYYEQNADSLKLLAVDGGAGCVLPSIETVQDGTYTPLARPLYVYVKADSLTRPEVQEFMRFYLAEVSNLAEEVGYVDSPLNVYLEDQAKLETAIGGTGTPDSQAAPEAEATPAS
ncbi:MAG: PstS family phosphate ABC transporter substrate-binding protein [Thermomicrobiales bacterium]|nr:PstS family phosphate ABC transporter substrate-binding protein [Thermomicrobiales bacterium]